MKKLLFPLLLAAMLPAQAADYFLPYTEADGSANVRSIDPGYPVGRAPVIKTLPNGTRVQIVPILSKGSWLLYDNQGAYTENVDASFQGYIHKSQLRRAD